MTGSDEDQIRQRMKHSTQSLGTEGTPKTGTVISTLPHPHGPCLGPAPAHLGLSQCPPSSPPCNPSSILHTLPSSHKGSAPSTFYSQNELAISTAQNAHHPPRPGSLAAWGLQLPQLAFPLSTASY